MWNNIASLRNMLLAPFRGHLFGNVCVSQTAALKHDEKAMLYQFYSSDVMNEKTQPEIPLLYNPSSGYDKVAIPRCKLSEANKTYKIM